MSYRIPNVIAEVGEVIYFQSLHIKSVCINPDASGRMCLCVLKNTALNIRWLCPDAISGYFFLNYYVRLEVEDS